ncbi:MAG: glycosyltransferase family A protein [Cyanobacteria bacterium P01_C01_bin.72]
MPQVSVVIAAYNLMAYLPETIANVLQQTFSDFEVIVVDDGSTDNTAQWIEQITDPRVRLISQENQGLSGACNTGVINARGEYIAFLDADDLWEKTKLAQQVEILDQQPEISIVSTWVTYMNEGGESTGRIVKPTAEGYIWRQMIEVNQIECGSVIMIRRSCFDEVGLFDTNLKSFVQDWDMWLRLALKYQFRVIPQPLVYYRQRSSSGSRNLAAMERSFNLVLTKAYDAAPAELKPYVSHGYGFAYSCLAWKALQNQQPDYQRAKEFQQTALTKDPDRYWSKENLRLTLAIALMRWLGKHNYLKFLSFMQSLRSKLDAASVISS